ncbi:MAG TPA: 23S rRNA (guanosine(2251)-2'-O)-methyltransferase RlmB [Terriglobia bacterium]|nr:23S rRNA (guanosine(2251)-2'-O)-methyltransferase RlmB [Terriglobia bacterium]
MLPLPMSSHDPKTRLDTLYGIHAVKEALASRPVDHVLVAEGRHGPRVEEIVQLCRARGVPVRFAPGVAVDRLAGTPQHQNVVAVCAAKGYASLESLVSGSAAAMIVVLDGVEDPANLGAVARTAVAAGAGGIVVPERRATGLTPAVARSAAGALEHLKVARVTNLTRALNELKEQNLWVFGFEAAAAKSYLDLDYSVPCALVLGGEGRGLHRLVRETCDHLARIPLYGPVESLNVSVAAAVVLYEAARQRHGR